MNISEKNRNLLAVIQSDFPITEKPFKVVSGVLGWAEDDVIDSIITLKKNGVIREFGPVFDARSLGYISTLSAVKINPNHIEAFTHIVIDIPEITHCYLRDNEFNIWFTITAYDQTTVNKIIDRIKNTPGVSSILNLPALEVYKINAVFDAGMGKHKIRKSDTIEILSDTDKKLIIELQKDFPIVDTPFKNMAKKTSLSEKAVIDTVSGWIKTGVIRRFGARLNHRNAGYTSNCMAVWKNNHVNALGMTFAKIPQVSHCYRRQSSENWPYTLYTMVHAKSENELSETLQCMKSTAPNAEMLALKTVKELKKTSMKYFLEDGT